MRLSCSWLVVAFAVGACGGSVTGAGGAGGAGAAGAGAAAGSAGAGSGGSGAGGDGGTGAIAGSGGTGAIGGYGGTGAIGGEGGTGAMGGAGGSGGGPACCVDDTACAPGGECAEGYCRPIGNGCWRDADCGPGAICQGAGMCPCPELCGMADHPGTCMMPPPPPPPPPPGCCTSDADCDAQHECYDGACEPRLKQPGCWRDADCGPYAVCAGAYVCPCGAPVMCTQTDHPGSCEYYNAGGGGTP